MTSHNSPFGFIHSLRLNSNNVVLGGTAISDTPYPPIVYNPNFKQVMNNWNIADTNLSLLAMTVSTFLSYRCSIKIAFNSIFSRKLDFGAMMLMSATFSFILGARNSYYRLEGMVPNGLKARKVTEPVKYDYTSEFLNNSFLSLIYEGHKKPSK